MKRGLVLVEGQTERDVVRDVLAPYFAARGLALDATIVTSKRVVGGPSFKGGVNQYGKVRNDLVKLLHDSSVAVVTTMIDYYHLPTDFPGYDEAPETNARGRLAHLEQVWGDSVADRRFVPHLVLHELEAWVYAAPDRLLPTLFDDDVSVVARIAEVAAATPPEDIDDGEQTSPSKRLKAMFAPYQKTLHGPLAIGAVGLDAIRRTCPHAAAWLDRLQALAAAR